MPSTHYFATQGSPPARLLVLPFKRQGSESSARVSRLLRLYFCIRSAQPQASAQHSHVPSHALPDSRIRLQLSLLCCSQALACCLGAEGRTHLAVLQPDFSILSRQRELTHYRCQKICTTDQPLHTSQAQTGQLSIASVDPA